jgi:suppressor of ftsI/bilirubin oxidase
MQMPSFGRRRVLAQLGAFACAVAAPRAMSDRIAAPAPDWCGPAEGARLLVPGEDGWLGRLAPKATPVTLTTWSGSAADTPWPSAYAARHRGRSYRNPTLVFESGERARIVLANTLEEPTIVHWHGLQVDTANDGAGLTLVPPAGRYAYDFVVRARAGLYWYHPHPHGLTAGQTYHGLFGMMAVEDAEERALRQTLDVSWGKTEIPLVLQDRRPGPDYAPDAGDRHHGFIGNLATVNGGGAVHLDVASRAYRFRILNASNARTYRLGFADAAGRSLPFTLLGTDGGLLAAPLRCDECYLSSAERIDVLLDLTAARIGDAIVLETREFDPMHLDAPAAPGAAPSEHVHSHAPEAAATSTAAAGTAPWPEGSPRRLLTLRVRDSARWRGSVPARLSALAAPDTAGTRERAFRLGFAKGSWRINDRVFAMDETPIEVERDATEVWLLRNYHTSMPHAMHLHGFQFRVLERETSPGALERLAVDDRGRIATDLGSKDTVLVWPGESVRIAIDFRHPFPGTQSYMFHCHNLEHEDGGMMLRMKVG